MNSRSIFTSVLGLRQLPRLLDARNVRTSTSRAGRVHGLEMIQDEVVRKRVEASRVAILFVTVHTHWAAQRPSAPEISSGMPSGGTYIHKYLGMDDHLALERYCKCGQPEQKQNRLIRENTKVTLGSGCMSRVVLRYIYLLKYLGRYIGCIKPCSRRLLKGRQSKHEQQRGCCSSI